MRHFFTLILVALFILPAVSMAVPDALRDVAKEADSAYQNGDFDQAVTLYLNILDTGYSSGPLLYNLGNAYYKSGRLGESILMYERAAKLMPHNRDVRHNLELARLRAVDRIDTPPRLFVWKWLEALRDSMHPSIIAYGAWIFSLLLAISLALAFNMRHARSYAIFRNLSWVLAVLFVLNLGLLGLRASEDAGADAAIIMVDKVDAFSGPDRSSKEMFALHEGTKVEIVQELNGWAEIRLADGRQGWLPESSFTII
ncbi:tetratricopeptide repeat protein [bacterium]|nr:tetratricopeptide repeat protein [bacterium]